MTKNAERDGRKLANTATSSPSSITEFDVAIVGGGLSGMVAAMRLIEADPNLRLCIVEREAYLGGQLVTSKVGELGGKWISMDLISADNNNPKQPEVREFLEHLGLETIKMHDNGHWANVLRDRHSNIATNNLLFSLIHFELSRMTHELDILCGDYNPKIRQRQWDWTMEIYIKHRLYFNESQDYMLMIVRATCGIEANQIFVHEFLTICFSCGGFTALKECLLGTKDMEMPVQGWTNVINAIQQRLPVLSVDMRLSQGVTHVRDMEKRFAILHTSNGSVMTSKVAIMACTWQALNRIRFEPRLSPNKKDRLQRRDPYIVSGIFIYSEPFWLRCRKTGQLFDYKNRLICFEYAPCTLSCQMYFNSLFDIPIDPGQYLVEQLAKHYGIDMMFPVRKELKIFEQTQLIDFPEIHGGGSDVIIWASTNAGLRWRGFINGAVQAGNRASVLALNLIRPSLITSLHIRDVDPNTSLMGRPRTTLVQRCLLSLNLSSLVRLMKMGLVGTIAYWSYRRLYRVANASH